MAKLYTEYVAMEQKVDGVRKERNDNAASMKVRQEHTESLAGAGALTGSLASTIVTGNTRTSAPVPYNVKATYWIRTTIRSAWHTLR